MQRKKETRHIPRKPRCSIRKATSDGLGDHSMPSGKSPCAALAVSVPAGVGCFPRHHVPTKLCRRTGRMASPRAAREGSGLGSNPVSHMAEGHTEDPSLIQWAGPGRGGGHMKCALRVWQSGPFLFLFLWVNSRCPVSLLQATGCSPDSMIHQVGCPSRGVSGTRLLPR